MLTLLSRFAIPVFILVTLAACFAPKTPQETAAAFWEAVARNDAAGAVRYSTLEDEKDFDGFGRAWAGTKPTIRRIVIEGERAAIVSEVVMPGKTAVPETVTTYLLQRNGTWLVDYRRTAEGMQGNVFAALLGELNRLGRTLTEQIAASSKDFNREMESMLRQMVTLSESLNRQASESIARYGEALRGSIDALGASAREALNENGEALSERDRQLLDKVAGEMETQSDRLSEPDADSVAEGTEHAARAQQMLLTIDEEAIARYKREWIEWRQAFEKQMQTFIEAFNAEMEKENRESK